MGQAPFPSPNWQASPARIIEIPTPTNLRGPSLVAVQEALSWSPKSSADVLDYALDPTAWLAGTGDFLLSPISVTVPSSTGLETDLSCLWATNLAGMAVIFMAGGAPGSAQAVNVALQTQQGRRITVSVSIAISSVTNAVPPPPFLVTSSGYGVPPNAMTADGQNILSLDGVRPLVIA